MNSRIKIKISVEINESIKRVWRYFTFPAHVCRWNHASDDWHCPEAVSEFAVNGKFSYRMEAKDGSFGFDFSGTFLEIIEYEKIVYILDDNRKVEINFVVDGDKVIVTEEFEAEEINSIELQQMGWQAILNNFKNLCENFSE